MDQAVLSRVSTSEPFVHEIVLDHPIETVWQAITRKALVDQYYFAPLGADISEAGVEMFYGLPDSKAITGTIVACEAPTLLKHTFRFAGDSESPDTTVTYRLAANGGRTELRIEHSGYLVPSQGYSDIAMGWPIIADRLKAMLDGG